MGWSFAHNATRADVIKELTATRAESNGTTWTTLAHATRGNVLYYVVEITKPEAAPRRFIGVSLLAAERGYGWGSKDMEESMGPCEVSCPLSYLDMVPDPGSYATKWREHVRAYHARKAVTSLDMKRLAIGDTVRLREGCKPRLFIVRDRKGRTILGDCGGITYRIPPRALEGAEIIHADEGKD